MSTQVKPLTPAQQERGLQIVAAWLATQGYGTLDETPCPTCGNDLDCEHVPFKTRVSPAPTGEEAARHGLGPVLVPDWDWPSSGPTPAVILEGGPFDWAINCAGTTAVVEQMAAAGIFCEPYASWALCLYPVDGPA